MKLIKYHYHSMHTLDTIILDVLILVLNFMPLFTCYLHTLKVRIEFSEILGSLLSKTNRSEIYLTSLTFYGGVKDIGGNKFLVDDKGTKIFMDFGMSFTEEGRFFAEFLNARTSNSLIDMFELGILPKIKGLYRRDYA